MRRRTPKREAKPYSFSAKYYDQIAEYIDYNEIVDYVEELVFHTGKEPQKILDLGCGTGTVALILKDRGCEISGIDPSKEMIDIAKEKAKADGWDIPFSVGTAQDLNIKNKYELVLSLSDCINHIIEPNNVKKAFKNVFDSLQEGGLFVFDINTPYEIEHTMSQDQEAIVGDILYRWDGSFNNKLQLGTFVQSFYSLNEDDTAGELLGKEIHKEKAYRPRDLKSWLKDAGFIKIESYEAFTREKPDKLSPNIERIYIVAHKP